MKTTRQLLDYLDDIQKAAQISLEFTSGMDREAFLADERTQKAVFFNFVILGEAVTKLMAGHAGFLAQNPQVPWRSIRDMRNQVAHGYSSIDVEVVWRTVQVALPDLLAKLPAIIESATRVANARPPAAAS